MVALMRKGDYAIYTFKIFVGIRVFKLGFQSEFTGGQFLF